MNMKPEKSNTAGFRLTPVNGGTIIVFNTVQQGKFRQVLKQINELKGELQAKKIPMKIEMFTAFGPFDNVNRFDIDDFCLVNRISSMSGVGSQQIQCAYTIWNSPISDAGNYWKPFCCITQLKVQNHLMLGHGPEIEEAIGGLIADCFEEYLDEVRKEDSKAADDIEVELMATLGWDEFFIFARNSRGYSSMFKPIIDKIRPLTIQRLEHRLEKKFCAKIAGESHTQDMHLFLSTYSTPGYSYKLNKYIEDELEDRVGNEHESGHVIMPAKEFKLDKLLMHKYKDKNPDILKHFGSDLINVSTRLSIKPGHWDEVSAISRAVLEGKNWAGRGGVPVIDNAFSIGRYDVYPWRDARMSCKEFVTCFSLLAFSLAGNLRKEEEYSEFLSRTQYYNSYTVISYPANGPDVEALDQVGKDEDKTTREGSFVSQLGLLSLSRKDEKSIRRTFEKRDILNERVPQSIVFGLSRIFSLFDSCVMDRFTCDSFIDMFPFMKRVRDIIDTVEVENVTPGNHLYFNTSDKTPLRIDLPESWNSPHIPGDPLVKVFYSAIGRFYRGFVHRYLSSYPMMDKNETGVDFSGRFHRILSAITGMQNLLLDDLDCHIKKGFNSISTYPSIRIYRDSFNTTEATVYHLFQVESFFTLQHESIHTFIHSNEEKGKRLLDTIEAPLRRLKGDIPERNLDILRLILEEITGDLFVLKNAFYGDYKLFAFWYWLMLIQCKNKIDSQILLRFLLISYEIDEKSRQIIHKYLSVEGKSPVLEPDQLLKMMDELLPDSTYPPHIKDCINSRIRSFIGAYFDKKQQRERFIYSFNILSKIFYAIFTKLDNFLECCCYPTGEGAVGYREDCMLAPLHPPRPEDIENKKRQVDSIRLLRCLLTFIFEHREDVLCPGDGILNFQPGKKELRRKLFKYRIALTNTLQWESLYWKKALLETQNIKFPLEIC